MTAKATAGAVIVKSASDPTSGHRDRNMRHGLGARIRPPAAQAGS